MIRKLGWGAGVALLAAAGIAGCSSDKGSTIISGGGGIGDLGNLDNLALTSIASNNLAPDGGAFSHNGQSFADLICRFNNASSVTSSSGSADNTCVVVFRTTSSAAAQVGGNNTAERVWASHYDGTGFTPPVELSGEDRNDRVNGKTNVSSIVLMPLNVKGYLGTNGQALTDVQKNAGNWVILWDAVTSKDTPGNIDDKVGPIQSTPLAGPHHTIY
jgi:hypothetical protein